MLNNQIAQFGKLKTANKKPLSRYIHEYMCNCQDARKIANKGFIYVLPI